MGDSQTALIVVLVGLGLPLAVLAWLVAWYFGPFRRLAKERNLNLWTSVCCCLCNAELCCCDPPGIPAVLQFNLGEEHHGMRDVEAQTDPSSAEPMLSGVYKPIPKSLSPQRGASSSPTFVESKKNPGVDKTAFRPVSGEDDEEEDEELELVQLSFSKGMTADANIKTKAADNSRPLKQGLSQPCNVEPEAAQATQPSAARQQPNTVDEYRAKELERHRARMLQAAATWREEGIPEPESAKSQKQTQAPQVLVTEHQQQQQQQLVADKERLAVRQAREKEAEERRWAEWNNEREKEKERAMERLVAEQKREKDIMKLQQQQPRLARLGSTRPPSPPPAPVPVPVPVPASAPAPAPAPAPAKRAADVDSYLKDFEPGAGVASMKQLADVFDQARKESPKVYVSKKSPSSRRLPSSPGKEKQESPPPKPERQKKDEGDVLGGVVSLINPWGW